MYYNTGNGYISLFCYLTWQVPCVPALFIPERSHATPGGCRNFKQPLFVSANTNGFVRFILLVKMVIILGKNGN